MELAVEAQGKSIHLPVPLPIQLSLKGLTRHIHWPAPSRDLIEVACAILMADRLVTRPRNSLGPRQIDLALPVRNPHVWNRAVPVLQEILEILGGDVFSIDFCHHPDGAACFPINGVSTQLELLKPPASVDRVALFSGGLDSAAAAATFALEDKRAVYVTHYTNGIRRIEKLLEDISAEYNPQSKTLHAQFYIRHFGPIVQQLRERSRRSRSFLFVSLALATAAATDAPEVCVCENGPLALNLPLTPAMIPTRHAHSQFLRAMERLATIVFDRPIRVLNPFELMTKGEMSRVFAHRPELALRTVSCWNQQWSGRGKSYGKGHCGHCFPCLVRRASLEAAGIAVPEDHFDVDVQRLARKPQVSDQDLRRLSPYRALLKFSGKVKACRNWQEFVRQFPQCIETEATRTPLAFDDWFPKLYQTMSRFAEEIDQTFGRPEHNDG